MNTTELPEIDSWHAHVYYDEASATQAQRLCELARDGLPVQMGRLHRKPVGPHPMWSCQLSFAHADLAQVLVWLNLHRAGLTVFVHPNTGDDLGDHRDRDVWLGQSRVLSLSMFEEKS